MSLATTLRPFIYPPFRAGLYTNADAAMLLPEKPGTVPDCGDVTFFGEIVHKRFGFDNLGAALSGTIQYINDYFRLDLTQFTVAIGTAGAWSWSDATGTWTNITSYAGSLTQIPSVAVFNGILVVANGTDTLRSWDGIAGSMVALTGTPPSTARYLLGYKSHLIAFYPTISGTTYPFRYMWSDLNNINQWASGDAGLVDLLDTSDPITGAAGWGEYGIMGRRHSVWNLIPADAPAFYQPIKQVDGKGVIAYGSMQPVTEVGVYYLSDDDLYLYNAASSQRIGGPVMNLIAQAQPNTAQFGTIVSTIDVDHAEYWMAFPSNFSVTSPDQILVHSYANPRNQYFTRHFKAVTALGGRQKTLAGTTWGSVTTSWANDLNQWGGILTTSIPLLTAAAGAQPLVQSSAYWTENGATFPSYVTTPLSDYGVPAARKSVDMVRVRMAPQASGQVSVSLLTSDIGDLASARVSGPYTQTMAPGQQEVYLPTDDTPAHVYGAVKVTHQVASDLALKDVTVFWRPRGAWA